MSRQQRETNPPTASRTLLGTPPVIISHRSPPRGHSHQVPASDSKNTKKEDFDPQGPATATPLLLANMAWEKKNDRNHLQGQRIVAASSVSQPSWPCCRENPAHLASPGQCPPGTDSADQAKKKFTALGLGTSCRQQNLPCPTDTRRGLAMETAV